MKTVANYGYNGTGNLVEVSLPQPATPVKLLRDEGADGDYENLDRFGRIKTQHWKAAATTVDRVDYTYDTAGNRLLRDVPVAGRDQSYSYDKLHRLRGSNQGTWNGSFIPSPIQQLWNLDLLGNWNNLTEVPGISQNRAHNNANEILSLNSSSTSVAHDESGNMTRVPRQADWSNYFELKYDAWNRLTEVKQGTTVIGSYAYDGLHRRISRTFTVGSTTTTEQYYYNENWQFIEVRTGTESGPTTQKYVWHPYYIDALAARYWDGNGDNDVIDANESHFPLHDGNFNVTALLDSAGTLFERYFYSAYGQLSVFDAAWAARASSIVANPYTYTGRQYDSESGIYQYRYRYYHAQFGRFVGRDPAGYLTSMSLSEYVRGAPLSTVDPLGLVRLPTFDVKPLPGWELHGVNVSFTRYEINDDFILGVHVAWSQTEKEWFKAADSFDTYVVGERVTRSGDCCFEVNLIKYVYRTLYTQHHQKMKWSAYFTFESRDHWLAGPLGDVSLGLDSVGTIAELVPHPVANHAGAVAGYTSLAIDWGTKLLPGSVGLKSTAVNASGEYYFRTKTANHVGELYERTHEPRRVTCPDILADGQSIDRIYLDDNRLLSRSGKHHMDRYPNWALFGRVVYPDNGQTPNLTLNSRSVYALYGR